MTEQNVEVPQGGASLAAEPNPATPSQEASTVETLRAELDQLKSMYRGLQSKEDKDAAALEKKVMSKVEQAIGALGVSLTPEQKLNLRVMELEEQIASRGETVAKPQTQTTKEPQQPVDIAKIKEAYKEIDFNRPDVLQVVSQNLGNEDGLLAALGRIKVGSTAKPQPTAASVASPTGGAKSGETIEDLQAELASLRTRDPLSWKQNQAKRAEIIAKIEQLDNA